MFEDVMMVVLTSVHAQSCVLTCNDLFSFDFSLILVESDSICGLLAILTVISMSRLQACT